MNVTLVLLVLAVLAVLGGVLVLLARWHPARIAVLLAFLVVVFGLAAATAGVVSGIRDREVTLHGSLEVERILEVFAPPAERRQGLYDDSAHLTSADGVATKPQARSTDLVWWSVHELAPWVLAAIVLALVVPILRATGRGDPFAPGATRRLSAAGVLLLLGIPAIAIQGFLAATIATEGQSAEPYVEPSLTISAGQFLPGFLVLALVGIFRRGVELRDLERHTI